MSTKNPSHGTKNTTDPARFEHPSTEGAGNVVSDSLAAESTRAGGKFSQNRDAEPSGVPSKSTTANNTETRSASELPPARDAEERADDFDSKKPVSQKGSSGGLKYTEGSDGQGEFPGTHTSDGYVGGPAGTGKGIHANSGVYETGKAAGSRGHHVDTAPSYVELDVVHPPTGKPKGANLTEGGFDADDSKNASYNTDIGADGDPGRLAENKFERRTAEIEQDPGGATTNQEEGTGDGPYESLREQEA